MSEKTTNPKQFFGEAEMTPIWVTGKVYAQQGSVVEYKVLSIYCNLIKRNSMKDRVYYDQSMLKIKDNKSFKLLSLWNYVSHVLNRVWDKKIFNRRLLNSSFNGIEINILKETLIYIDNLNHLLESVPELYLNKKRQSFS